MKVAPPFTRLADVYDAIMADIEYEEWAEFVLEALADRGWFPGEPGEVRVLDLAAGTGNSALPYRRRGFAVTLVDASAQMLAKAGEKMPEAELVRGDFLDFSLPGRFHLVTCVFDSLNNLTEPTDLAAAFARVLEHLEPGGWFAFDVNTASGVRELWEDDRLEGEVDGPDGPVYYRWTHVYDPATGLGRVTAYCRTMAGEFVERHAERGYDPAELEPMLEAAGFSPVSFLEYPDHAEPDESSPRVWAFARRPVAVPMTIDEGSAPS